MNNSLRVFLSAIGFGKQVTELQELCCGCLTSTSSTALCSMQYISTPRSWGPFVSSGYMSLSYMQSPLLSSYTSLTNSASEPCRSRLHHEGCRSSQH